MAEINLGGKRRELKFNFKSMRSLEKHFNKPISKIFENEMQGESLGTMVTIFWSFLINDDKKLTVAKVEDIISDAIDSGEVTMDEIGDKIQETMEESQIAKTSNDNEGEDEGESDEGSTEDEAKN